MSLHDEFQTYLTERTANLTEKRDRGHQEQESRAADQAAERVNSIDALFAELNTDDHNL